MRFAFYMLFLLRCRECVGLLQKSGELSSLWDDRGHGSRLMDAKE